MSEPVLSPTPITPFPGPDKVIVNDMLTSMRAMLDTLNNTFNSIGEQSEKVNMLGSSLDATHQITSLRRQLRSQEKKQDARIADVKHMVKEVLKDQIAEHLRQQIEEQIRAEIALQVRSQVAEQLRDHLPIPLEIQAEESRKQLNEVKWSLVNSEARRANSTLRANNIDDPLHPILKADGMKSELFPKDLKTLFGYDGTTAKLLMKEYGLADHEIREKNLNRFMQHIGIPFHLIPVPQLDNPDGTNALGLTLGG